MPKLHLLLLVAVLVLIAHGSLTDEDAPSWAYAIAFFMISSAIVATMTEIRRLDEVVKGNPKPPFWDTLIKLILNIK